MSIDLVKIKEERQEHSEKILQILKKAEHQAKMYAKNNK